MLESGPKKLVSTKVDMIDTPLHIKRFTVKDSENRPIIKYHRDYIKKLNSTPLYDDYIVVGKYTTKIEYYPELMSFAARNEDLFYSAQEVEEMRK